MLTVTVYSLNSLGDAVRDLLDPRLIGGAGRLGAQDTRSVRVLGVLGRAPYCLT